MKRDSPSKDGTNLAKDESAPVHDDKRARGVVIDGLIIGADATNPEGSGGASALLSLSIDQPDVEKPVSALNATLAIPTKNVEPTFSTKEFEQTVEHTDEPGQITVSGTTVAGNGDGTLLSIRNDAVVADDATVQGGDAILSSVGGAAVKTSGESVVRSVRRAVFENGDAAAAGDTSVAMVDNHGVAPSLNGHHCNVGSGDLPSSDAHEENRETDSSDESEVNLDDFFHFSGTPQQILSLRRRFAHGLPSQCIAEQREGIANDCGDGAVRGSQRPSSRTSESRCVGNDCCDNHIVGFGPRKERAERRRFVERYNFDIMNDRPLKGRYHWVRINEDLPGVQSSNEANGSGNGFHTPGTPSSPKTPSSPVSVVTTTPPPGIATEATPTTSSSDCAEDHETETATADQVLRMQAVGHGHEEVQA